MSLLLALINLGAAPAHASSPSWTAEYLPQPPNSGSGHRTFGVSCAEPDACVAVGENWSLDVHTGVTLAEHWDDADWAPVYTPYPTGLDEGWKFSRNATLKGVSCPAADSCLAVGWYRGADDMVRPIAERWDGEEWELIPVPLPNGASGARFEGVSCTSPETCLAVGRVEGGGSTAALAERWDGTGWDPVPIPSPADATASWLSGASCPTVATCVVVGAYETGSGAEKTLAATTGDGEPQLAPPVNPGTRSVARLDAVSCPTATACTAVGYFQAGFTMVTLAEGWNGDHWVVQPTPTPNSEGSLLGVSCSSASACTAVGAYYVNAEEHHGWRSLIERWDGSEWTVVPAAEPEVPADWWHEAPLRSVSCLVADGCTAVGSSVGGPGSQSGAERAFATREIAGQNPPADPNEDPDPPGPDDPPQSNDPAPPPPQTAPASPPAPNRFAFGDPVVRCDGRIVVALVALGPGTFTADADAETEPRVRREHSREAGSKGCVTRAPRALPKAGSPKPGNGDRGQRIEYGSASATAAAGGHARMTIYPRPGVLDSLRRQGRLRVEISIAFGPTGGTPSTQRRVLVLRA